MAASWSCNGTDSTRKTLSPALTARFVDASSSGEVWNPRGHVDASGPELTTTRPSRSVIASTSAEIRRASLSVSRCTVASSSASVVSDSVPRSVSQVSSAALRVGFSASVATVAWISSCRRASTRVKSCCAEARLSVTDLRTRPRISTLITTKTATRTSATVKNEAVKARDTNFGGTGRGASMSGRGFENRQGERDFCGRAWTDDDPLPPFTDSLVPRHQRMLPGGHVVDRKFPGFVGNGEPRMVEYPDERAHLRVNVAVDLDDAWFVEGARP